MAATQLAATLYNVREFIQTREELTETLKKVRAIGYESIQVSALREIPWTEAAGMIQDADLTVCATHVPMARLDEAFDEIVADHRAMGCKHLVLPSVPGEQRSADGYVAFAKEASEMGRRLAEEGICLGYHNHSFELERYDGRTALDILYQESDPKFLQSEIDTYWIQHGGGDPAAWIRKLAGRAPVVHLKDMAVIEHKPTFAEVGEGNLDWPAILEACKEAGTEWYVVEQDTCQGDPFDSLATSYRNLRAMGLQ